MYIIELIVKLIKDKRSVGKTQVVAGEQAPEFEGECDHIFFPIDSTNEVLACTKCGLVVNIKNQKIKQRNPFD